MPFASENAEDKSSVGTIENIFGLTCPIPVPFRANRAKKAEVAHDNHEENDRRQDFVRSLRKSKRQIWEAGRTEKDLFE